MFFAAADDFDMKNLSQEQEKFTQILLFRMFFFWLMEREEILMFPQAFSISVWLLGRTEILNDWSVQSWSLID